MQAYQSLSGDWQESVALQYEWWFCLLLKPDSPGGAATGNPRGPFAACKIVQTGELGDKAEEVSHVLPAEVSRLPEDAIEFRKESAIDPWFPELVRVSDSLGP